MRGRWIAFSGTQHLHNTSQALLEEIIHEVPTRTLGLGEGSNAHSGRADADLREQYCSLRKDFVDVCYVKIMLDRREVDPGDLDERVLDSIYRSH